MDNNTIENLKSILNGADIPSDLQNILSNISSSNTASSDKNDSISPEALNNLISAINNKDNSR